MKAEALKPFPYKGKLLKVGEEVTMTKNAFELWSKIDHVKEVKEAPVKSGKGK